MSSLDVQDDILKFVDDQLKPFHGDKRSIVEWVDSRSLKSKRFKKRLVVLSNYRILSIKKGKLNVSLNKNICIYDISDITVIEDVIEIRQRQVSKTGDQIGILIKTQKEVLQNILYQIREIHRRISHNFPESLQLKLHSPPDYLIKLPEKKVGVADNFIDIYNAQSNYRCTVPSLEVCRLVEKYVNDGVTDFDLTKCPGIEVKSELNFNIETLILSLRYNTYFQSIIISGVSQKNLISSIGEVIQTNCYIKKIVISGNTEEQSLQTLGQSLASNPFNLLLVLDISNNSINQNTFQSFCEGLESMRHPLKYFNIANCNLHGRSIELLFHSLSRNMDLSQGMEYFNISGNKFEDIGSSTCSNWIMKIKDTNSLKSLYISNCALNLLMLGPALKFLSDVKTLDLSLNRLEKAEVEEVISLISNSKALETLDLSNCQLANEFFVYVANTTSKNLRVKSISMMLANNLLGKNVNSLVNSFEFLSSLYTLDLSGNNIGYKGLTRLLDSLRKNEHIHCLKLDHNFSGNTNEALDFATEIKNFIKKKPSLRILSLGGSSSYSLPDAVVRQLLEFLCTNLTIEELNISGNYLGDSMASSIANLFEQNKCLKSLEFDKNHFTINAFQTFLLSLQNNHNLVNIPFPTSDFEKSLVSLNSAAKKSTLFNVFHRIQIILHENGTFAKPDQHFYPTPVNKIMANPTNVTKLSGSPDTRTSFIPRDQVHSMPSGQSYSSHGSNTEAKLYLNAHKTGTINLHESLIDKINDLEDDEFIEEDLYNNNYHPNETNNC